MTEQKSFGWAQNDGSSLHIEMVQTVYSYNTVQYSTVVSLGPGLAWRREEMNFKLNVDPISCSRAAVLCSRLSPSAARTLRRRIAARAAGGGAGGADPGWRLD